MSSRLVRTVVRVVAGIAGASLAVTTAQGAATAASTTEQQRSQTTSLVQVTHPIDKLPDAEPVAIGRSGTPGAVAPTVPTDGIQADTAPLGGKPADIEIGLPQAESLEKPTLTASGTALYADEQRNVDYAVQGVNTDGQKSISSAVRTLILINSAKSPTSYQFPIDLPAGSKPVLRDDGSVSVVNSKGGVLGTFAPPWAVDAAGKTIETRFTVTGRTLTQHVQHAGATYPVIADPVWMVPVLVVGLRVAAPIVVRAATKQAAKTTAKRVAANRYKSTVKKTGTASRMSYKSKTRSNFRHNLEVRTGKNPRWCQAHHMMPLKFVHLFAESGVNINDPKYGRWWTSKKGVSGNHQSKAWQYNKDWEQWWKAKNGRASQKSITWKRTQMHLKYRKYYGCGK